MMKNGRFRRRYIVIPAVCVLAVISAVFLLRFMPQRDVLPQGAAVPAEYMPQSDNHVSYQTGNECSAYAAAVGYDEQYFYLADSLPENANSDGGYYNRRVSTEEFQRLWRTDSLFGENIYIVAEQK